MRTVGNGGNTKVLWLAWNTETGEGRVFTRARFARLYARKRGWRKVWVGMVA